MNFTSTPIAGLQVIEPRVFGDERGYFFESYKKNEFAEHGITEEFVQDNQSFSQKNIVRGLHFQAPPMAQSKLVRIVQGEVFDVAVDIRPDSPTFGKWFGITLSEENKKMFYIPVGFAHGFCVTSETAVLTYKCSQLYSVEHERGIKWDDPAIGIDWPVDSTTVTLSDKDGKLPTLEEIKKEIVW